MEKKRFVTSRMFCDHADVVLGFALQEAARAAHILALLTSFRSCLRLECVSRGEAYLSKTFCTGPTEYASAAA